MKPLFFLFVIAFGLRLAATAMFEGLHDGPRRSGFSDGVEFNAIATNLVTRGEFAVEPGQLTSFRAPGFPLFLAGIYAVAGANNFLAFHLVQALLGALLVLVVYGLGKTLAGPTVGLVAAALTAIYPNLLYYCIHFSSEPLFTLLLTTSTWAFVAGMQTARGDAHSTSSGPSARPPTSLESRVYGLKSLLLSGLLLGLAALVRPLAFYFTPLYVVAGLWLCLRQSAGCRLPAAGSVPRSAVCGLQSAVFLCAVLLPILPWTARNYRVHQRFLLLVSNGGSTFWGSNNAVVLAEPAHHGDWVSTNQMPDEKAEVLKLPNEVDRDRLEWDYGKRFLREHPAAIPRLLWYKLVAFWTPFGKTPNKKFNAIILVTYAPLLPFMIAGIVLALRSRTATLEGGALRSLLKTAGVSSLAKRRWSRNGVAELRPPAPSDQAPVPAASQSASTGSASRATSRDSALQQNVPRAPVSNATPTAVTISLVPVIGCVLGTLAFYGAARFRSTIEPILLIFAAGALVALLERMRSVAPKQP